MKNISRYGLAIWLGVAACTAVAAGPAGASTSEVTWTFSAKKLSQQTWEVHLTAQIHGDFHIYSQNAGAEGPIPTSVRFVSDPHYTTSGKVFERGRLIKTFEDAYAWKHNVMYYEHSVDFVQVVKTRTPGPAHVRGMISFMAANSHEVLPPADVDFDIPIGG